MKTIDSATRSKFFPSSSKTSNKLDILTKSLLGGNDSKRKQELDNTTKRDADVKISDAIKDFSKIKKAVDAAPPIDNSEKIARLKREIATGNYKINYDALADKMINHEV